MRSHDFICIFLKIKIKPYQVPFQNIYGLLWFCVQLVDELKQIKHFNKFCLEIQWRGG